MLYVSMYNAQKSKLRKMSLVPFAKIGSEHDIT